jgi:hypothetical protein
MDDGILCGFGKSDDAILTSSCVGGIVFARKVVDVCGKLSDQFATL